MAYVKPKLVKIWKIFFSCVWHYTVGNTYYVCSYFELVTLGNKILAHERFIVFVT